MLGYGVLREQACLTSGGSRVTINIHKGKNGKNPERQKGNINQKTRGDGIQDVNDKD